MDTAKKHIAASIIAGDSDTDLNQVITEYMDGPFYFDDDVTVAQWRVTNYQILRKWSYPNLAEKADADVKINSGEPTMITEGSAQLSQYYTDCLAVKARFPKE